ncbi:MAG: amino acid permease, partial [Aureibaculum sp.]
KAIRASILIILGIYILIQTVSPGILGGSLASFLENPLAEVASQILGPIGFALITIGAAVSMFGNLSSEILSMPRVLFAAAEDKVIPIQKLSAVHHKFATPYVSVIAYASCGLLFASLGGFRQMAIVSSAASLLIYLGVSLAVIKLRAAKSAVSDTTFFKIRGGYTVPILSSAVIIWLLSNLSKNEFWGMTIFIIVLSVIYVLLNLKTIRPLLNRKRE